MKEKQEVRHTPATQQTGSFFLYIIIIKLILLIIRESNGYFYNYE
jgi:hypothetical protein